MYVCITLWINRVSRSKMYHNGYHKLAETNQVSLFLVEEKLISGHLLLSQERYSKLNFPVAAVWEI